MNDNPKTGAFSADISIGRVVHAAQINELLKAANGRITQCLHDAQVIDRRHFDSDLVQSHGNFRHLRAQNLNEVLLELLGVN